MRVFITVEEAHELIRASLPRPTSEMVPLSDALGRVVLDEVLSKEAVPGFDNSAMDGFAVRSADLTDQGGSLKKIAEVQAGAWPESAVVEGTCIQIMTGAPMPAGADAVVPVEWTSTSGDEVVIDRGIAGGRHVRPSGQDMELGQQVLPGGVRVGPSELSALISSGHIEVAVGNRPRTAVISTGDELVPPGPPLRPGQIRNSNGPALAARIVATGAVISGELTAKDNLDDLRSTISRALSGSDVLVFSGGVSMGKYDLVREVLDEMGFEPAFWKVQQRPGKPLAFGRMDGKPVFGLPGNPVSAAMCFDQYVRPSLLRMQGVRHPHRARWLARLEDSFAKPKGLHVFARGVVRSTESGLFVQSAGAQGSNLSMSLVRANCTVHLPAAWTEAPTGSQVDIELT